jgi:hypothetical protein
MNIAFCCCVRNCAKYLKYIFLNIDRFRAIYPDIYCVFVYDNCVDNSAAMLFKYQQKYKHVIIKTIQNTDKNRTVRISKARNECLSILYNEIPDVEYHMMIDCDNVNVIPWNINVLLYYLKQNHDWDCISFNRDDFYDIWALLFDNYKQHCYGFNTRNTSKIIHIMQNDICKKLKECPTDSIEVISAFNGFSLYRTQKLKGCIYDGLYANAKLLTTDKDKKDTIDQFKKHHLNLTINDNYVECCEHIYYHLSALKNGCKIKLSKFDLFQPYTQKVTLNLKSIFKKRN